MKIKVLLLCLLISTGLCAQVDYSDIELAYGHYSVGYRHLEMTDSTRSYSSALDFGKHGFRPISMSIWEPCSPTAATENVRIQTYFKSLKIEEEWPNLPNEYFYDWFYIAPSDHNKRQANRRTHAVIHYDQVVTNKPVILYSASFRASSVENFVLCEYLASYGYTVVAIPSKGMRRIDFEGGTIRDATAQSDDLQFVIGRLSEIINKDHPELYLMGFSFGGLSHILNACQNRQVKGVISIDGTVKYRPEVLAQSAYYDVHQFTAPFIHFSQKDISRERLLEDGLDTLMNTNFRFYDQISVPTKYQIKAKYLSHTYFSSFGLLFNERDVKEDAEYHLLRQSYAHLLASIKSFMDNLSSESFNSAIFEAELLSSGDFEIIDAKSKNKVPGFQDLINRSDLRSLASIDSVYHLVLKSDANFKVPEGDLNLLGLQLIFTPATYTEGVNVFQFALKLYPNSANLYDSLAEGYRYHGDNKLAKEHFLKSLELNPNNQNAKNRLKQLE